MVGLTHCLWCGVAWLKESTKTDFALPCISFNSELAMLCLPLSALLDLVNDLVQALYVYVHWCETVRANAWACIHLRLWVCKQMGCMSTICACAGEGGCFLCVQSPSPCVKVDMQHAVIFSPISDVGTGVKDKAVHFQWYYASTVSPDGQNRGKELSSTLWLFNAVDSVFTWGSNQTKQLRWQKCWAFDLLLTETEFESVCIHASRQLKSDTPASKYNKSFAIMCACWVGYQQNISQSQKLQIKPNIWISGFLIAM